MLEIFLVVGLCKALGNRLRAKDIRPLWMQVMLVASWILGEIVGGIAGGVLHVIRNGPDAPIGFSAYLFAIGGAALGAGFTFLVAYLLPANNAQPAPQTFEGATIRRPSDPNNPYAP